MFYKNFQNNIKFYHNHADIIVPSLEDAIESNSPLYQIPDWKSFLHFRQRYRKQLKFIDTYYASNRATTKFHFKLKYVLRPLFYNFPLIE